MVHPARRIRVTEAISKLVVRPAAANVGSSTDCVCAVRCCWFEWRSETFFESIFGADPTPSLVARIMMAGIVIARTPGM